ncbi:MAG: hypothetical protein ACOYKE_09465 [Ferruginibacter sp.]
MKRVNDNSITDYTTLINTIESLKETSALQEEKLSNSLYAFIETLNPITLIKKSMYAIVNDNTIQTNLATTGLHLGSDYILDKILGRGKSFGGFVRSVLVEKISNATINKYSGSIIEKIKSYFT